MLRTSCLAMVCAIFAAIGLCLSGCTSAVEKKAPPVEAKPVQGNEKGSTAANSPAEAKPAVAEDAIWVSDFEAAKAKAKDEKKLLLVDFTGSDWCGWCIKLKNEVFDKEAFRTEAPKQFVCVELDFPQGKELSKEIKEQNEKLSEQYKVNGFPTVLVMDPEGQVIARTGYNPGGPEAYLKQLKGSITAYEGLAAIKLKLEKAKGLDRAKLLDQMVDAYEKLDGENEDIAKWRAEIITLDAHNKAGLKQKYEFPSLLAKAEKLAEGEKFSKAKAAVDKALALPSITPEQKQEAYVLKSRICHGAKDFAGSMECLKQALAAAPNGQYADDIKGMIGDCEGIMVLVEKAAKIKTELENTVGIDRAKLLDQLVDAQEKLADSTGTPPAEIAKLSKEIIALDADNKAGLKQKHEIHIVVASAMSLMDEGKAAEAGTVIEKAMATPDLSPDNVQQLHFARGNLHLMADELQKGLECLRKALEVSPQGPMVAEINDMIRACEEQTNAEKGQPDEPKEEAKAEKPKSEEPKAKEPKTEEPTKDKPAVEEPKGEEPKAKEPKTEEPKDEKPKTKQP